MGLGLTQPPIGFSIQDPFTGENALTPELPSVRAVLAQLGFVAKQARAAGLEHLALAITDLLLLEGHGLGDVAAGTLREIAEPIWKAAEEEPPAMAEVPS